MEPPVLAEQARPKPSARHAPLLALGGSGLAGLLVVAAWATFSPEGASAFLGAHFWGPMQHQAELTGSPQYTMPALLGYGSVLAIALGLLHEGLIVRAGLRLDRAFVLTLAPFFLWGPMARALEDSGFLLGRDLGPLKVAYLVTEPLVYVTSAALAVVALLWGLAHGRLARKGAGGAARATGAHVLVLAAITGVEVHLLRAPELPYHLAAWWTVTGALVAFALYFSIRRAQPRAAPGLSVGLLILWPLVGLTGAWTLASSPPWAAPTAWAGNHPAVVPLVAGGAIACALVAAAAARAGARWLPGLSPAGTPLAGALVFAHALDALSTIVALRDPFGWGFPPYGEQNPVSDFFLSFLGGWPFLGVKVALALVLATVIRDASRGDGREDGTLAGLLAVAVFALGFGPGARNLARLAMGV